MAGLVVAEIAAFLVSVGVAATIAMFIAEVLVYAAIAFLLTRMMKPKRRQGAGLGSGTEINYYDSGAPVRILYGEMRIGGMETIPPEMSGGNNQMLHKVLTVAGHEVNSFACTWFDTTTINNASIGPMAFTSSDGQVTSHASFGPIGANGYAFIRYYRGTSTDSADRILCDANSVRFGKSRAPGIAKVALTFRHDTTKYKTVPSATFLVQGKKCYDPRLDVTPGASPTNAAYCAFTKNPALCLTDYLMASYGGSYASADFDWTTVVNAANACDALVNIPGSTTQPRYTCNGVLFADADFIDNVRALVDTMLGRIMFRDGKWRMYAGSWQSPTFTVPKNAWVNGGLSIRFEQGRARRFNRARCWYVDPQRDWQRVECLPRYNSTYATADGEVIDAETEQLMCTSEYETQRKAEFLLRQSRNQITVVGRLPPKYLEEIALWDTGTIVFDHLGWSSKTFRCVGNDIHEDGSFDSVFMEEQSGDWTDMDAADYNNESTATLPAQNATTPSEPTSLSLRTNINGTILFSWTPPVVNPLGTEVQIIMATNCNNAAVGTTIWQGAYRPVALVVPTSPHWYWARAITPQGEVSAYSPNTFGILGFPRAEADNTRHSGIVPDWDFELQEGLVANSLPANSYWHTTHPQAGNILTTGGTTNGYMYIGATSMWIFALPSSPYPKVRIGYWSVLRARSKVSFVGNINSTDFINLHLMGWNGQKPPVYGSNVSTMTFMNLTIPVGDLARSVDLWKDFTHTQTVAPYPVVAGGINPTSYPYFILGMWTGGVNRFGVGEIQFDYIDAEI
jgi:hypothetical protein